MNFEEIANIVKKSAPVLGAVISSSNPLAGIVIDLISQIFGVTDSDDLASKIQSDPDAALKLKNLEYQHIDFLSKVSESDRESARQREEDIAKITGKRDYILDVIALVVILGFFLLALSNYFFKLSDDHVVSMLIGQVSSGFMLVLGYYFGASNK